MHWMYQMVIVWPIPINNRTLVLGIHIHNTVIINKHFCYVNTFYFKKNLGTFVYGKYDAHLKSFWTGGSALLLRKGRQ
jgi:hypothetical protein